MTGTLLLFDVRGQEPIELVLVGLEQVGAELLEVLRRPDALEQLDLEFAAAEVGH